MKFRDISQFTRSTGYRINVSWRYLPEWIEQQTEILPSTAALDLDPDFQRGHVWEEYQQVRYIEFILRGGSSSKTLLFNCTGWNNQCEDPYVLVDGKQRLDAVMKFLNNNLCVFGGSFYKDFSDMLPMSANFQIEINDLATRAEVLQWYLDVNTGGVVHTSEEIERVKLLLSKESK